MNVLEQTHRNKYIYIYIERERERERERESERETEWERDLIENWKHIIAQLNYTSCIYIYTDFQSI